MQSPCQHDAVRDQNERDTRISELVALNAKHIYFHISGQIKAGPGFVTPRRLTQIAVHVNVWQKVLFLGIVRSIVKDESDGKLSPNCIHDSF